MARHEEPYRSLPLMTRSFSLGRDDDQFTFPKELRGLGTQLHSHGVPSSITISPTRFEDNNLACLAKMPFHPALTEPSKN
jgi:hypothetical protein